ncbi:MAG: alpha-1,4-glucan--maltose-1-phosphate maltosyltransferase [Actinomycetota bacterium]
MRDVTMRAEIKKGHIVIERVSPELDCGRYRAKAVVGDVIEVAADIFRDGPDLLQASIRYKGPSDTRWSATPMAHVDNDRWSGVFRPTEIGRYRYTVEAWTDHFGTWRRDLIKRVDVGRVADLELEEGAQLLEAHLRLLPSSERRLVRDAIETIRTASNDGAGGRDDPRVVAATDERLVKLTRSYPDRSRSSAYKPVLELTVDRERARFGAWYEFFPRSTGVAGEHGTFKTAARGLARIADLGFDVVYLPPIHPIGTAFRKGRNNSLAAEPGDVGVPWAIGNVEGGHSAVHPDLGTIDDFDDLVAEAQRLGLEIALDFAIQCSPDHPWVKEHPEWFHHRPDGTIKYAENPPKKYQDVYPVNFDTKDKETLWTELKEVIDFWISHGVKIFRVDNPHTKPFTFWQWLIDTTQREHPDVIFLSEAFTRPKVMRALAKLGFTQSYTYFTWRNTKWELTEYLMELTRTEMAHFFRPNFFTNTQDILHEYLQTGGPAAFKIRFVLAALLSPTYGIYSGFELFENVPRERGSEEYLHSEKYELRPRDFDTPNSLSPYIKRVNEIRRKHPALSQLTNLHFHQVDKDHMLAFSKSGPDGDTILAVVNLNPFHWEEATLQLDLDVLGVDPHRTFEAHDLISDDSFAWHGPHNYVRLDPFVEPAHIFRIQR